MLSLTISMLTTASCVFPLHQGTLLQHWMVCSHVWPVYSWMSTNELKPNPDETEFLLIGNERPQNEYLCMFPIELFGVKPNPAKSAWNLGVIFDLNFTFRSHISAVCSSCFYHMQDLQRIRLYLHLDSANYLQVLLCPVVSIIAIHFCMVSLTLTSQGFKHVYSQQARLVTKSPPLTWSFALLRSLHWLLVRFRIFFKINCLTCKTLCEKQHVYPHSILAASLPSYSLRLNRDYSLSVPRVKTNTGARGFHSCAPSLWNNLPPYVRSAISVATFKKHLNTHLFDLAFPP